MMGYGLDAGVGGWLWMIGGVVVMIGIVVLIIWAVGGYTGNADRRPDPMARSEPLDILRARFARGEITEAEFTHAKATLGYDR